MAVASQDETFIQQAFEKTRRAFWFAFFFSGIMNILMLALPIYSLQVFDRVISSRSVETLFYLSLIVLAALACYSLLNAVRQDILVRIGNWLDHVLSPRLLAASISGSAIGHPAGNLQNLRDFQLIKQFLTGQGLNALFDAPFAPIYLLVIFLIHPVTGITCLIGGVILISLALLTEVLTRKKFDRANKMNLENMTVAGAIMRNAEAVEAMGMMPTILTRWQERNMHMLTTQHSATFRSNILVSFSRFVRLALQVAVVGVGAYLAILEQITVGGLIATSILTGRALAPFEQAISMWRPFIAAREAYNRVNEAMHGLPERHGGTRLPSPRGELRVEELIYRPPGQPYPVIRGINFTLPAGESLGIIGPSATGKSTIAKLITGVWKPTAGAVRLDGADVYQWMREDIGQHIGYLPQAVEVFPGTVKENISRMQADAPDEMVVEAAQMAGIHELILSLPDGYDTVVGEMAYSLSPGQKQRVGLARALYGDPRLVVLDEPNSNLDSPGEMALLQALQHAKRKGMTVIMIAHKPSVVATVDKIMMIRDGSIESYGPREEVLAKYTRGGGRTALS